MYPARVDSKSFIESLYDEFGIKSPTQKVMLTKLSATKKKKVGKKIKRSKLKDTKKKRRLRK
jgi:hypothetical protein